MKTDTTFLKSGQWDEWREIETDQDKGIPAPPIQKAAEDDAPRVDLPAPDDLTVGSMPLIETIRRQRSRCKYTAEPLSLEVLSFLLWSTQGVSRVIRGGRRQCFLVPSLFLGVPPRPPRSSASHFRHLHLPAPDWPQRQAALDTFDHDPLSPIPSPQVTAPTVDGPCCSLYSLRGAAAGR